MLSVAIRKTLPEFELAIDFQVAARITVLFGPSGCGKTTILRCISGLMVPDAGKVTLAGQTLFDAEQRIFVPPYRRGIGYVFQEYALFPHLNVAKNILYGVKSSPAAARQMYDKLLRLLKIESLAQRFPAELSGGEKQRVALARALMAEPRLLLLDEPLSALDNKTRFELQDELLKIQQIRQIPFILVTHDPDEAEKLGHQVIFMERGKRVDS